PGPRDTLYVDRGGSLQTIHACCHVEIIRKDIRRGDRGRVCGRHEKLTGIGFKIELLRHLVDEWPALYIDAGRRGNDKGGASFRDQSERTHARTLSDAVCPRARGVDNHGSTEGAGAAREMPEAFAEFNLLDFSAHDQAGAARPGA